MKKGKLRRRKLLRRTKNKPDLLVLGLGNPGEKYNETRHNVGFRVVQRLFEITGGRFRKPFFSAYRFAGAAWKEHRLGLVQPLTYMNNSGHVFPDVLRKTGAVLEDLIVVCDTLDLDPGMCRLKRKGGSAGHRGIASIIDSLGTSNFMRLYIGVGRPADKSEVVNFVLGRPDDESQLRIREAEEQAAESILRLLEEPPDRVMHDLNRRKSPNEG